MNQPQERINTRTCHCDQEGFFITVRQSSLLIVGLLILGFFIFMIGYFWGKKTVVDEFCLAQNRESLADKIYSSLCVAPDQKNQLAESCDVNAESSDAETESEIMSVVAPNIEKTADSLISSAQSIPITNAENTSTKLELSTTEVVAPSNNTCYYYAKLVSFKSRKSAQQFVNRLAKLGIEVELHALKSKTAKGRVVNWYQVVTKKHTQKDKLKSLVSLIKEHEKLDGEQICTC